MTLLPESPNGALAPVAAASQSLDHADRELVQWVLDSPRLARQVSAAVDPLEVAARIESFGLSARVLRDRFGFDDVFSAAEVIYDAFPRLDASPAQRRFPAPGSPFDLLRGVLYALPAVFFTVVIMGFSLGSCWWILPVGLSVAWASSQAAAVVGWDRVAEQDSSSNSLITAASLLVTALLCMVVGLVAATETHATATSVLVTMGLGIYIAASGVLLFHSAERILLMALVPALIGSVMAGWLISSSVAAWWVVASAAIVVYFAFDAAGWSRWKVPTLSARTRRRAGKFLLYGLGCGLLTSSVVAFGTHATKSSGSMVVAAIPLLLTLGLMEWQLRTFRSRTTAALVASASLDSFARRAATELRRSVTIYLGVLLGVSVVATAIALSASLELAPLLIGTVDLLGLAFFLALILAATEQINRVLIAWAVAFGSLGLSLLTVRLSTGSVTGAVGVGCVALSACLTIAVLSVLSRSVLTSPLLYQAQS
jgi:hypothetical protein